MQKIDALHKKIDSMLSSMNLPTELVYEASTVFRAPQEAMPAKKKKEVTVKAGDLKKAVAEVSEKKQSLKKVVTKVVKKVAPKKVAKKAAPKKVVKKKK